MRLRLKRKIEAIFQQYDALITPVSGRTAGSLGEKTNTEIQCQYDANTVLANLTGIPAISVPMGMVGTTPVGLQIMAPRFEDAKLLRIARAYEKTAGLYEDGFYPAPHLEGITDA